MNIIIKSVLLAAMLPSFVIAANNNPVSMVGALPATEAQYKPVSSSVQTNQDVKDFYSSYCNKQPTVVEFFSYACPGCSAAEPDFKNYLATKAKNVVFIRVPVVFNIGWDFAAKMYYTNEKLGITEQFHDVTFAWVQNLVHQRKVLTDADVREFITKNLANPVIADSISNKFTVDQYMEIMDSTTVSRDSSQAMRLLAAYNITTTPSVVVNNKYIVTLEKAQTMANLIKTINKLTTENTSC